MKLWEVLKALEENPKKKFETKYKDSKMYVSNSGYIYLERYVGDELLDRYCGGGGFTGNFKIGYNDNWTEVKQPVTWQEALEAWAHFKRVYCIDFMGDKWTYEWDKSMKGELESIEDGIGVSPNEINEGTWYIEN